MAKSKKTRRDAFVIASEPASLLASRNPLRSGREPLRAVEDRRQFYPGVRPLRTLRQLARVQLRPKKKPTGSTRAFSSPHLWQFDIPKSVAVCVRRAVRKQVMHAKKKAGKAVRRPKRNALSRISCKR